MWWQFGHSDSGCDYGPDHPSGADYHRITIKRFGNHHPYHAHHQQELAAKIPVVYGTPAIIVRETSETERIWNKQGNKAYPELVARSRATLYATESLSEVEQDRRTTRMGGNLPLHDFRDRNE